MIWKRKSHRKTKESSSNDELSQEEYDYLFFNVDSPYQSKRETANTVKGFFILTVFVVGIILLLNWVAVTFGNHL